MDGNGRWAKARLMGRIKGHEKGAQTVREIVRASRELGIRILTLYAFSTENWQRPPKEISALMALLNSFLKTERDELVTQNIRLNAIGQIERLPENVRRRLAETMAQTRDNDGMLLNLALSYGGRDEILRAVRLIADRVRDGDLDPGQITAETVSDNLYTHSMPDPDLMIRTSGEMRISNFLLWQIAYAEIYVTPTLWPDFGAEEYLDIIREYQGRERRFGKVET
jgi:undecaprenyl diphosphate synthase